ncbi:MAG: C25 family cysteine peptidase, partial [Candidatus Krumholzibacteria bacterium]|nr:C25 family cysteine peptidase [Candidatus Krumholzibacteria bacterium]
MGRLSSALIALVLSLALTAGALSASTLSWNLTLDPSSIKYQETAQGRLQVLIDGYSNLEYLDYPALPYRVVSILVPQGEDFSSCRIEILEEAALDLSKPVGIFHGASRVDGTMAGVAIAKVDAESSDGIFPARRVQYLGSSYYRGYRIANVAVYPIRYSLKSGALTLAREVRLIVETAPAAKACEPVSRKRAVSGFREESRGNVEGMVINPEEASAYSFDEIRVDPGTRAFLPSYEPSMDGSTVKYLIVTNEAMKSAFQRLADCRTKEGIPAVVRTVEWISENVRSGADRAESIRNYICAAYEQWGVEWVVLGGDTDVIPARFAYCSYYTGEFIPTDMYYSCLDGTWNADGDSLWGEAYHSSSLPGDEVDLYSEVYVGRMPASTLDEANILVNKAIEYSTPTDTASRSKFLILAEVLFPSPYYPGDPINLDGAEITEPMYANYLESNPDVTTTRLYEIYYDYSGALELTKNAVIDSMNAGTNHILDVGHGNLYNMSVGNGSIINYDA